ncbi:cation transporter [Paenibacillus dakarensis]|uniref:cation transporter n=1 Tax=Paenibacillus dakarensis TaxID=1527293 RepID=UPI0006D5ACD8|nr:cation transporter [Paenibacillus dakarensis]
MKEITLNVEGMSCNHCVNSVEGALKNAGMTGKVDLASNTVTVQYDENKDTVEKIKETIEEQGYDVV